MFKFKHLLSHATKLAKEPIDLSDNLEDIVFLSKLKSNELIKKFKTSSTHGLTNFETKKRLLLYGKNEAIKEQTPSWPIVLLKNFNDPLSLLLVALIIISVVTRDYKAVVMISVMVVLSVILRFFQEIKADKAAQKLRAMVHTTIHVIRNSKPKEVPLAELVPGDIIHLSSGDMIPADVILLSSKDLFVNQATLTSESLPAEKHAEPLKKDCDNCLDIENVCFLGTNVESGTAIALVAATGRHTYIGAMAKNLTNNEPPTSFDIGIKKFTWLIMTFILIMVPAVFLINGLSKHDWVEALIFALAVAVGLAPEMLPMIVAVNLSKGAMGMSKKKVIVKHLNSVQNFGAMEILCTDKTGTLTEGYVILEKYLNIEGIEDKTVLEYSYLNSFFQTGLNNLMDTAILKHHEVEKELNVKKGYKKIDEIPFDFSRRRMSVVVETPDGEHILICKGATEEIISASKKVKINGKEQDLKKVQDKIKENIENELNADGFRVVAVAYKKISDNKKRYSAADENDLVLLGFLAFLDPPKASAKEAIAELERNGIEIKVLTGDNEIVTKKICSEVGLDATRIILGHEIEKFSETELTEAVQKYQIFAKLTPLHKEKIVRALRASGKAVGFMGDGINDAPALRAADIGISVDSAADIAKESSDIILLEKSLMVLKDGVIEGRKIFGNVVKYIEMAASSNFGNMFSVVGASIFLPFLPMLPIQILTNNLLYDVSQTSIPTDQVDEEYLTKPRKWNIDHIKKFILFIGPISSLFDFATYFIMLYVFNAWVNPAMFHTGWFIESLASQTLIIYVIRTNKIPFLQSWPSKALLFTTLAIVGLAIYLPYSPLASTLKFVPLPGLYWWLLAAMLLVYFALTQTIKMWFIKKYKD